MSFKSLLLHRMQQQTHWIISVTMKRFPSELLASTGLPEERSFATVVSIGDTELEL